MDEIAGNTAILECTVSNEGAPMTWMKNGQELKPDGKKYEVVADGTKHKLIIKDLTPNDEADYSCRYGDDESSCRLHVEGKQCSNLFLTLSELLFNTEFTFRDLLATANNKMAF
jgi:hypothetical protein